MIADSLNLMWAIGDFDTGAWRQERCTQAASLRLSVRQFALATHRIRVMKRGHLNSTHFIPLLSSLPLTELTRRSRLVLALYTNRASAVLTDNLLHPHLNIAAIYSKFSVFFSSPPTTQEDKRTTPTEHITKYLALTITALDRNSLALVHVTHNSRYKHCSRIRHIQAP
jgi:hypothetical protein